MHVINYCNTDYVRNKDRLCYISHIMWTRQNTWLTATQWDKVGACGSCDQDSEQSSQLSCLVHVFIIMQIQSDINNLIKHSLQCKQLRAIGDRFTRK